MKAFTLVEVLISVVILAIVLAGISGAFISIQRSFQEGMGMVDLQQNIRMVMDGMVRELRQSSATIISPQSGVIKTSNYISFISSADISFKIPKGDMKIDPNDPTTYYEIRYYFDTTNQQIKREYPTGTERIIANNIEQVSFCLWKNNSCCDPTSEDCSGVNILRIQLRAAKTAFNRQLQFPLENSQTAFTDLLTEKVRLRNE
ncbi:MAG: prepilin-type N-terminal cleavage/methylation domain-containing protein [Candidatus Omnitrophota bacterium]